MSVAIDVPVLPTLLGSESRTSAKGKLDILVGPTLSLSSANEDTMVQPTLSTSSSVAHDNVAKTDLTFDELVERVHSNKLENVSIMASELDSDQKTTLIMRGTRLRTVLAGFGKHLKDNKASGAEFNYSYPVEWIDEFFSHAWSTKRWMKTLTLLYYYNFYIAMNAYTLTAAIAFIVVFYIGGTERFGTEPFMTISAFTMMLNPSLVFFIFLLFGTMRFGRKDPSVFFDKLCIHQTNSDLKLLAINSLETFVRKSKRLVLLFDCCTYDRMWCAYETAMFAHDRQCSATDFRFIPVASAVVVMTISVLAMTSPLVLLWIIRILVKEPADTFLAYEPAALNLRVLIANLLAQASCPVMGPNAFRQRWEDSHKLVDTLTNFKMSETKCFDENDRVAVHQRIVETWGDLKKFDAFMRNDVYEAISRGQLVKPWHTYTMIHTLAAPPIVFNFWMAVNSPSYPLTEALVAGFIHGFILRPLCCNFADKVACLVCALMPASARWVRTAVISLFTTSGWVLYNYVHCSIWMLSYKLSATYGLRPAGCLVFLPFFLFEVGLMARKVEGKRVAMWSMCDTFTYAPWLVLAGAIFAWNVAR